MGSFTATMPVALGYPFSDISPVTMGREVAAYSDKGGDQANAQRPFAQTGLLAAMPRETLVRRLKLSPNPPALVNFARVGAQHLFADARDGYQVARPLLNNFTFPGVIASPPTNWNAATRIGVVVNPGCVQVYGLTEIQPHERLYVDLPTMEELKDISQFMADVLDMPSAATSFVPLVLRPLSQLTNYSNDADLFREYPELKGQAKFDEGAAVVTVIGTSHRSMRGKKLTTALGEFNVNITQVPVSRLLARKYVPAV